MSARVSLSSIVMSYFVEGQPSAVRRWAMLLVVGVGRRRRSVLGVVGVEEPGAERLLVELGQWRGGWGVGGRPSEELSPSRILDEVEVEGSPSRVLVTLSANSAVKRFAILLSVVKGGRGRRPPPFLG